MRVIGYPLEFAAPADLKAGPEDTGLALTWTAPAGYDMHYTSALSTGASPVTGGAAVQTGRPVSAADGWVAFDRDTEADPPAASQMVTGLMNDTEYRVRVRATGAAAPPVVQGFRHDPRDAEDEEN